MSRSSEGGLLSGIAPIFILCILGWTIGCVLPEEKGVYSPDRRFEGIRFPRDAVIHRKASDKTITLMKAADLALELRTIPLYMNALSENRLEDAAGIFLDAFYEQFRLLHPSRELVKAETKIDEKGVTRLFFHQRYKEIPVPDAQIRLTFSEDKRLSRIDGDYIPTPVLVETHPKIDSRDAIRKMAETLPPEKLPDEFPPPRLIIAGLSFSEPRLAWHVRFPLNRESEWEVILDAVTGDILTGRERK